MSNQAQDPIEQYAVGLTLHTMNDLSQVSIIHAGKSAEDSNATTLKEFLGDHKQQAEILALVLEKQNELTPPTVEINHQKNDLDI